MYKRQLPVFLAQSLGWDFWRVGGFLAAWVIGYGVVQAGAPKVTGLRRGALPDGRAAFGWAAVLAGIPAVMAAMLSAAFPAGVVLVVGLLLGEWLHAHARWPKVIGYVLAGILFGPSALGWISIEALAQARPIADAALGLLMMEVGRRLDLGWLRRNPELLRSTLADITLSFALIFIFALWLVGLTPARAAATTAPSRRSATPRPSG